MQSSVIEIIEQTAASLPYNPADGFFMNTVQLSSCNFTAADLSQHLLTEHRIPQPPLQLPAGVSARCYQCGKQVKSMHGFYVMCCVKCGKINLEEFKRQHMSEHTKHVHGRTAFVVGGRTKIGYQTVLRLLRAGAFVIATTRFPDRAWATYQQEHDYNDWFQRLSILELDLNQPAEDVQMHLDAIVQSFADHNILHIDILINVAAQTINGIERHKASSVEETNRYGDCRYFPHDKANSWQLQLGQISASELESVFRVNAIGPTLIVQSLLPYLLQSTFARRMIINTHAREGLFDLSHKAPGHPHTNMAKSALHQLTMAINTTRFQLPDGSGKVKIDCHGIDPGWISTDEYSIKTRPMQAAPLTEMDGASRLLQPLFARKYRPSSRYTIRHFGDIGM